MAGVTALPDNASELMGFDSMLLGDSQVLLLSTIAYGYSDTLSKHQLDVFKQFALLQRASEEIGFQYDAMRELFRFGTMVMTHVHSLLTDAKYQLVDAADERCRRSQLYGKYTWCDCLVFGLIGTIPALDRTRHAFAARCRELFPRGEDDPLVVRLGLCIDPVSVTEFTGLYRVDFDTAAQRVADLFGHGRDTVSVFALKDNASQGGDDGLSDADIELPDEDVDWSHDASDGEDTQSLDELLQRSGIGEEHEPSESLIDDGSGLDEPPPKSPKIVHVVADNGSIDAQ